MATGGQIIRYYVKIIRYFWSAGGTWEKNSGRTTENIISN